MKSILVVFALVFGALTSSVALAQSDPLEPGKEAFREGRYEAALRLFEQAASEHPNLAEAHFLVSRVYFETPLRDEGRARRALEKALDIQPNNVEFLVARLEQFRIESSHFLGERVRETRRLETARKILELDPDNAYAHEELGRVNIRDFWRYRNAIMMPGLSFGYAGGRRVSDDPTVEPQDVSIDQMLDGTAQSVSDLFPTVNTNEILLGDQFDLDALRNLGVNIVDLSERADRAYQRSIGHFRKALEVDPRRRTVYDEMMQIFALQAEYEEALETLGQMYRFFPEDEDLWRYFGLVHYKLGDMVNADRSFSTAFEYMSPEVAAAYNDLGLFLNKEEKELEAADAVAYRARYWLSQEPRYLTSYNERKLEHYFRLTYADLLYSSKRLELRGWETERGQILIRYGLPLNDVVLHPQTNGVFSARQAVIGAMAQTIEAQADLSLEEGEEAALPETGVMLDGEQSFGTVHSTARQAFEEMNAYNIWDFGDFKFVFEDPFRNGEYRMYSPSAEDMVEQVNTAMINDYVMITREIIRETPQRYEYNAPGRQVELPYLVSTFKSEGPQTDVYVHYGVPLTEYDPSSDMVNITANAGTFLIDERRDILVERRRTVYGLRTDQVVEFAEQNLWVDTQTMQAPAGLHELSVEFETASGQTVGLQRRSVTIPDYSTDELALSDIMLAYSVEAVDDGQPLAANEIVRDGLSILPAPWTVYATNWPIYLYFEIYGLTPTDLGSTDYDVEITLTPKETRRGVRRLIGGILGGGEEGVSVSYHGSGTQRDEHLYQILDASQQEMGLYTLTLRVLDNVTGKRTERTQDLFLEE